MFPPHSKKSNPPAAYNKGPLKCLLCPSQHFIIILFFFSLSLWTSAQKPFPCQDCMRRRHLLRLPRKQSEKHTSSKRWCLLSGGQHLSSKLHYSCSPLQVQVIAICAVNTVYRPFSPIILSCISSPSPCWGTPLIDTTLISDDNDRGGAGCVWTQGGGWELFKWNERFVMSCTSKLRMAKTNLQQCRYNFSK